LSNERFVIIDGKKREKGASVKARKERNPYKENCAELNERRGNEERYFVAKHI